MFAPRPSFALDIPLRGNRDYVHSTDLYAALDNLASRFLAPRAHVKNLTLHRQARRQAAAQFLPHPDAFGTFALALPHQTLDGWLVEQNAQITRRIAFDEEQIARGAIARPGEVFLRTPVQGFSGFEQMIVLFKILCDQSGAGAWMFTGIDLDKPLSAHAALGVRRTQTVLDRVINAELHQNGEASGRLQMVLDGGNA
jgi:hypothetical protein